MPQFVEAKLVAGPFDDPGVLLDVRFGARALLFDLGSLEPRAPREIVRVSHVFVSHMHMDHFAGFDRLLRLDLYQPRTVSIIGPPGLTDAVEHKLRAYTWNLLGPDSADFAIIATDWQERVLHRSRFRARTGFRREERPVPQMGEGLVLDEPDFVVHATALDHGIPSLAFALQESRRVNVHRTRLDDLGLHVGPWLTRAKQLVRAGALDELVDAGARQMTAGELVEAGIVSIGPGQRVAYATDFGPTSENIRRAVALARDADHLFIESAFLDRDRDAATAKKHLTARVAGEIARRASARRATPMHFSTRYLAEEAALREEFARAWRGENAAAAGEQRELPVGPLSWL